MESLLIYLPIIIGIACPVSMALMMWYMGHSYGQGMGGMNMTTPIHPAADKDAQITMLQEQVRALEASAPPVEKQSAHISSL